jgi:glycosyltransferase involved in cell wall biosynthesis
MIVKILLSTYNGEKYLEEQLSSLANQKYKDIRIRIRDDGSKDRTRDILEQFVKKFKLSSWYAGKNIGVINSFFELLSEEDENECIAYYAFCDQDDIWKPEKIERAVEIIKKHDPNTPIMYCSSYELLDSRSGKLLNKKKATPRPSLKNALVENIATGCSIVLNKAARDLIIVQKPRYTVMHDAWCYLVISALGTVIYDPFPSFYYRQHGTNVIGAEVNFFKKWEKRIDAFQKRKGIPLLTKQVQAFEEIFSDQLDNDKKKLINTFLSRNLITRLLSIVKGNFYRQSHIDDLVFKILYLLYKV